MLSGMSSLLLLHSPLPLLHSSHSNHSLGGKTILLTLNNSALAALDGAEGPEDAETPASPPPTAAAPATAAEADKDEA
jgi:hypothetical protein